jgi:acyl-coenzyme A thioesterase 13
VFSGIFRRFVENPKLKGTFAHKFYEGFEYLPKHKLEISPNILILRMKVQSSFINVNGSIHGGALSTIIDCATTLAILKVDPKHQVTVRFTS